MISNNKRLLFRLSLPLLFAATYLLVLHYFHGEQQRLYQEYAEGLKKQYTIIVNEYSTMADLVFHNSIETEEVLTILDSVRWNGTPTIKNVQRRKLLHLLAPLYSELRNYDFRQLHFHEPDNRSFLRFHRLDKYGDDLTGVRTSVEYVNRTGMNVSGFEEGRIFNGYRNVYPLSLNNVHLGSVELSISMNAVISSLQKSFGMETQFILSRSVVDEKVFESEQVNYRDWPVDPDYVLDINISKDCFLLDHISKKEALKIRKILLQRRSGSSPFSREIVYDKERKILSFLPILNFTGRTVAYLLSIEDNDKIDQLRKSFLIITVAFFLLMIFAITFLFYSIAVNRKLEAMITYDPLTGAFSRREIFSLLNSEYYRFGRYGSVFSLCMIDIDHFKMVNDKYGHQAGDRVLSELSEFINDRIRKSDQFGRYGGEEFLLILPETGGEKAYGFVETLRTQIEGHEFSSVGHITVSMGISVVSDADKSFDQIIFRADENLYTAKRSGRNRVVYESSGD